VRSLYLTSDHVAFRQQVRHFLATEVIPFADRWENERSLPRSIWQQLGRRGFLGLNHPKEYGGTEKDFFSSVVFLEELGRAGYGGFRASVSVHAYMATHYIERNGSDALKRGYLTPAIAGEKLGALGITEPGAGSDISRLEMAAVRDGGQYVLNGTKAFTTNGITADFFTLVVRTGPRKATELGATGLSVVVVDASTPGIERRKLEKLGWHCSDTADLTFRNVRIPATNLVGTLDHGFYYVMRGFQLERLVAAILALGEMEFCLGQTLPYLTQRKAFGSELSSFQAIRHRMADLLTDVEATRQLIYHAAWLYERGELPVSECSMAKLKATELGQLVVNECVQFFGGLGVLEGTGIARMYRDMRMNTIAGGTSEIMRDIIAQSGMDRVDFRCANEGTSE
jgi:acyl-CoA dehydrogenase